jgi:hypothetical protein
MDCQAAFRIGRISKHGLVVALALFALGSEIPNAWAQGAPQCAQFPSLSAETQKKANAVQAAMKAKVDRKEICTLMTSFVATEGILVKFLIDNKTWCGVPDAAIANSKESHEKSMKFRTLACNDDAPHPKAPSLSDAIKTPTVDSATNTKTGRGTFDTLTGNPLAR